MAITFEVSPVARALAPLRIPAGAPALTLQGLPVEALGASNSPFLPTEGNAFLRAVHAAYALHYPLVLSPDAVWLCIAQGFALHVNQNAEHLRGKLVRHEGQATIEVRRDDFVKGSPLNPWPEAFSAFSDAVAAHLGRQRDLVVCDFSTTGPCERAASEIVLLDAMQRYVSLEFLSMCGIPAITLEGTAADWHGVRRRARALEEYDTELWTRELGPVLDEIVATAEGRVDRRFWETLFKHVDGSGGPWVLGWINVLFPYVRVTYPQERIVPNRWVSAWKKGLEADHGGGPSPSEIPSGVSSAPFVWNYLADRFPMHFLGGFVGVAQDADSLALRPVIGWAVRDDAPPPPLPPDSEREAAWLAARNRGHVDFAATLVAGWLSATLWLTWDELLAIGARIERAAAEHGVPLAWAVGGDLGDTRTFPEAPAAVRLAVGVRVACAESRDRLSVSHAACLRALHAMLTAPASLQEALAAVVQRGLGDEPALHLVVAGTHLRGTLNHDATGATLAEVRTGGTAATTVELPPDAVGTAPSLTLSAGFDRG
jgi:hypothetical protein